eukprot:scaffold2756_cov105-Cylindrotheca_fusiformis.AAC.2
MVILEKRDENQRAELTTHETQLGDESAKGWVGSGGLLRRFKRRWRRGRKMVRILGVSWTAVGRSLATWRLSRKMGSSD